MRQLLIILIILFGFSSCTTNTTFTFHRNKKISLIAEIDMEGIIRFTGDSIIKKFSDKELSKNWKSLYQINKEQGKTITNKDTIKLAKKMFIKGLYKGENLYGFALRADRLSPKDWSGMERISKSKNTKYGDSFASIFKWDGKTLIFDSQELINIGKGRKSTSSLEEEDSSKEEIKAFSEEEETEDNEASKSSNFIKNLFRMEINFFYKFPRKIKSIEGTHPYLKQIDDYTLQFKFSTLDDFPKEKGSSKIIIRTK
jgi:hypothetical protein